MCSYCKREHPKESEVVCPNIGIHGSSLPISKKPKKHYPFPENTGNRSPLGFIYNMRPAGVPEPIFEPIRPHEPEEKTGNEHLTYLRAIRDEIVISKGGSKEFYKNLFK